MRCCISRPLTSLPLSRRYVPMSQSNSTPSITSNQIKEALEALTSLQEREELLAAREKEFARLLGDTMASLATLQQEIVSSPSGSSQLSVLSSSPTAYEQLPVHSTADLNRRACQFFEGLCALVRDTQPDRVSFTETQSGLAAYVTQYQGAQFPRGSVFPAIESLVSAGFLSRRAKHGRQKNHYTLLVRPERLRHRAHKSVHS
jgi:hypothetical protein